VQIISPILNGPVGPGMEVQPQTDFIGPIELGSFWTYEVWTAAGEQRIVRGLRYTNIANPSLVLGQVQTGVGQPITVEIPTQLPLTPHGAAARLVVTLSSPLGAVLDTTSQPVTYDALTGTQWVVDQTPTSSAQGGFNATDRANLDLVLAAVRYVAPAALTGGPNIVSQVIDLVRGPPRSFLRRFGSLTLTGRGTFSAQPPGASHSFGGTWSFVTVPAGYGKDDGALVEYHRRFVQFVVVRDEVTSDTYLDVLEDSHYEGAFILWQYPNPIQIQYDVTPGVVVLWQWLV